MPGDDLILGAGAIALYLLPAIVAAARRHPQGGAIFILNLLLGWTVLGWVAALVWSATGQSAAATRACPFCAEPIQRAAIKCRHCGSALEPHKGDDQPHVGAAGYGAGRRAARIFRKGES